jgi:hypothetical protein
MLLGKGSGIKPKTVHLGRDQLTTPPRSVTINHTAHDLAKTDPMPLASKWSHIAGKRQNGCAPI